MSGDGPVGPVGPSEHDQPHNTPHRDNLTRMRDYLDSSGQDYGALSPGEPLSEENGAEPEKPTKSKTPKEQRDPNNVVHDRFDERLYGELYDACEQIRKLENNEGAFNTFPELLSDFFYSFYKASPQLADQETVEETTGKTNRPFVERLLEDDETRKTRVSTRLDDMSAALAALAAGEKVLEEIEDRPELADFIEQASSEPQEGEPGEDQEQGQEQAQDGDENPDGAGKMSSPPSAPPSAPPRDLRRAIRAAAEAGAEDAERTQEALDGWGISPSDLKSVPLGERIELAKSLRNPRFKHLFDLVGRMRNLAHAKARESVKSRTDEIHSVELSGDLSRMLPAELAAGLATPSRARKLDFYRRFIEGQVLSYELTENEPRAKGPIVAAIDCSASMGYRGGMNMQWATAVALALVDLAAGGPGGADKRPAGLVFFNEDVKKVVRFSPGERDPRKLLEVATVGPSGGTRYEPAWKQMFTLCGESVHQGADILFVTDGICRVPEEFATWIRDEKTRLGACAYSVLLESTGSSETSGTAGARELERYSDEVWTTNDLMSGGDGLAGDILGRLA